MLKCDSCKRETKKVQTLGNNTKKWCEKCFKELTAKMEFWND